MRKCDAVALRCPTLPWDRLNELLPGVMTTLGLVVDSGAKAGHLVIRDFGERGCVVVMEDANLARRAARAFATSGKVTVEEFEVSATQSDKGYRYRAEAHKATPTGELLPFEGVELPLDDAEQDFGGGPLEDRVERVLRDFGALPKVFSQTKSVGYRKKSGGRPSTPRIATLVATLKKAKSFEGVGQPNGKVELRMEMAAGGKQTSYCTAEEFEELERLVGAKPA